MSSRRDSTNTGDVTKALEEYAAGRADMILGERGLLRTNTAAFGEWFGVPHTCDALLGVSGAKLGAKLAAESSLEELDKAWQARHLGVRAGKPIRSRSQPPSLCVFPGGCMCDPARRKLYVSLQGQLKRVEKELLRFSRVVIRLKALVPDVPQGVREAVSLAAVVNTTWFHLAYVCLRPWRATLVEVEEVDKHGNPFQQDDAASGFVKPVADGDGKPQVLSLQCMVNSLDLEWGYSILLYTLSTRMTPMLALRGHARVFVLTDEIDIWRGSAVEKIGARKVGRQRPTSQTTQTTSTATTQEDQKHAWGVLAEATADSQSEDDRETTDSDVIAELHDTLLEASFRPEAPMSSTHGEENRPASSGSSSGETNDDDHGAQASSSMPDTQISQQPRIVRTVQASTIKNWHGFRLTWVPGKKQGSPGAWQGMCPYHRKSGTGTFCKKTSTCPDASQAAIDTILLRMKAWCCAAKDHSRHRDHMSAPLPAPDGLDSAILDDEASSLQLRQAGAEVLRDDQLDAEGRSASSGAGAKAKPKPGRQPKKEVGVSCRR